METLLTKVELSQAMGVSIFTIRRWEKNGMPYFDLGYFMKRYDLEQVTKWYKKRFKKDVAS